MVFLATVLFSLALFVCRREVAERIVVSALSLWLAYESVLGIMQLLGIIVSHNSMCPMTGDFANSGPYGGFLAVCIAVVLRPRGNGVTPETCMTEYYSGYHLFPDVWALSSCPHQ